MLKYDWKIIGHEKQLNLIEKDVLSGNLAHAYLLVGAEGVGKFSVAKRLAGILQCENNFCQQCQTCIQVKNGSHIDTIEFNDDGESIGIDAVRELISKINMTPQSNYKITLIDRLERMSPEAANSFLKTLEEPPSKTIFIMTSDHVDALLETILSRVRIIKFQNMSVEFLTERLTERYPEAEQETVKQISLFSMGRTGTAVDLMESPEMRTEYLRIYNDVLVFLERKNIQDIFAYVEELSADKAKIETFLEILTHVSRSKMFSEEANRGRYLNTISKISNASELLRKNVNTRLVLENLMLSL